MHRFIAVGRNSFIFPLLLILSVCLLPSSLVSAFLAEDEAVFTSALPTLLSVLYRTPLPVGAPSTCVVDNWSVYSGGSPAVIVLPANSRLSASVAQSTCGLNSECQVPASSTLIIDGDLSLASLRVYGSLLWTDATQGGRSRTVCVGSLIINGGSMTMQIVNQPAYLYIQNNGIYDTVFGYRSFGGSNNATIIMSGRPMTRTWSLLAVSARTGASSISVMHNPSSMGWRIGDRIQIAPTTSGSTGTAETYYISALGVGTDNTMWLSSTADLATPASLGQPFSGISIYLASDWGVPMSAEVINLSRTIIITGDQFRDIVCVDPVTGGHPVGCLCDTSVPRSRCTMGLHTMLMHAGTWNQQYTRIEMCGQRGITAHYCSHFHYSGYCPQCVFAYNAVEGSMQRGTDIHETHAATIVHNVYTAVRGSNVFIEDGNEMYNHVEYNVAICPWALTGQYGGCTIPGTDNGQGDTALNQAGFWATSFQNYLIGNRAANSFNGMLYDAQGFEGGFGGANGKECLDSQLVGRLEGNTFHGHGRFGTYFLVNIYPVATNRALGTNGYVSDLSTCAAFDALGGDRGVPQSVVRSVDYQNTFVGQYGSGDIQYSRHASMNNNNAMYWKETKTFEDGCSAHITNSYYSGSNMALPGGLGSFLIEHTTFVGAMTFECSHHCNIGTTGMMCMSVYMFVNVTWLVTPAPFVWPMWGTNNGAMFTLAPNECPNTGGSAMFPVGFCSLANPFWTYLQALDAGRTCMNATTAGLGSDVDTSVASGILCRSGLRHLQVLSVGQSMANNPGAMRISVSQAGLVVGQQDVPYFQIGDDASATAKQGWSFTVLPGANYHYNLTLLSGAMVPTSWAIIFSDPVISNRWPSYADELWLSVSGRNCLGLTSGLHDRLWIWGGAPESYLAQPGRGACSVYPPMPRVNCAAVMTPAVISAMYIETSCAFCSNVACGGNAWCDCGTGSCLCQPGFSGANCEVDICACVGCSATNGACVARYLGGTLAPTASQCACVPGVYGSRCSADPCAGIDCGHGTCAAQSASVAVCMCASGWNGPRCSVACSTASPYTCVAPCIGGSAIYINSDFSGANIVGVSTTTYFACGDACVAMGSTCGGWAWLSGTCYIKGQGTFVYSLRAPPNVVYAGIQCNVTDITGGRTNEPNITATGACASAVTNSAVSIASQNNSVSFLSSHPWMIGVIVILIVAVLIIVIIIAIRHSRACASHAVKFVSACTTDDVTTAEGISMVSNPATINLASRRPSSFLSTVPEPPSSTSRTARVAPVVPNRAQREYDAAIATAVRNATDQYRRAHPNDSAQVVMIGNRGQTMRSDDDAAAADRRAAEVICDNDDNDTPRTVRSISNTSAAPFDGDNDHAALLASHRASMAAATAEFDRDMTRLRLEQARHMSDMNDQHRRDIAAQQRRNATMIDNNRQ